MFGIILTCACAFAQHAAGSAQPRRAAAVVASGAAEPTLPSALAAAQWAAPATPMPGMAVGAAGDGAGDAAMGGVLEWLQQMLLGLDLNEGELDGPPEEAAQLDELDDEFVDVARPWLHTKAFHVVGAPTGQALASQLWAHVQAADYLRPGGSGGSLLLLFPALAENRELLESIAASVRAAAEASDAIAEGIQVMGGHPEAEAVTARTPTPLIQLFLDAPDLLVEGGGLQDAAQFL